METQSESRSGEEAGRPEVDSLLARASSRPPSEEVRASLAAIQAARAAAELRLQRDSLRVRLLTMALLALVAVGTFALAGHLRARRRAAAAARAFAATIVPSALPSPAPAPAIAQGVEVAAVAAPVADEIATVTPATQSATPEALAACREAYDRHRWHAAADACADAFATAPLDASLALKVAQAQHARGHYADAGVWARRAIALEDVDPDAFVILAHAERRARHPAAAASAYRHYLILAPRGWHAAEARAALRGARAENRVRSASRPGADPTRPAEPLAQDG